NGDRPRSDGQWKQEELNGEGGRGDQRASSRGFALGKFFHERKRVRPATVTPEACKFYYVCPSTVKRGTSARNGGSKPPGRRRWWRSEIGSMLPHPWTPT